MKLTLQIVNVQEENEAEEEVLDGVASVMAVALRRWGDAAMPYVEPLMPAVGQVRPAGDRSTTHKLFASDAMQPASGSVSRHSLPMLDLPASVAADYCGLTGPRVSLQLLGGSGRTAGERRIGVIVMDDILEHAPQGAAKYMAQILPVLLQAAQDKVRAAVTCMLSGKSAIRSPYRHRCSWVCQSCCLAC